MVTAGIAKVITYLGMLASAQMCRTEVQLRGTVYVQDPRFDRQMKKKKGDPTKKNVCLECRCSHIEFNDLSCAQRMKNE